MAAEAEKWPSVTWIYTDLPLALLTHGVSTLQWELCVTAARVDTPRLALI